MFLKHVIRWLALFETINDFVYTHDAPKNILNGFKNVHILWPKKWVKGKVKVKK